MMVALHAALHAALTAALATANGGAPVPVTSTPSGPLPYVWTTSETKADDAARADKRGRPSTATKTVRVFASSETAARALAETVEAAMTDGADLGPRLAALDVRLLQAGDPFVTTGPDHAPNADPPLGSYVVRARYTLQPA